MRNEYDYLNDVKMDFSIYKEEKFLEKEFLAMKKNLSLKNTKKSKKAVILAACVAVFAVTTAFASGLVGNILKEVTTGYNKFVQTDPSAPVPVIDGLKGKIFDKKGNVLEALRIEDFDNIYDENGEKITREKYAEMFEEATGGLVIYSGEDNPEDRKKVFSDIDEAQENVIFDIKVPEYLPDGYSLSKVSGFKDDNGNISGEYLIIEYKNNSGKEIKIFERLLNEDTAFEAGTTGTIEEIKIGGRTAVIMNGTSLDFETADSVSVGIHIPDDISEDELIKIAESVK